MNNLSIGKIIKKERVSRKETLHQVAIATNIDSTIISKIERGDRLPTPDQLKMLSKHFALSFNEINAKVVAERIIKDYGLSQTTFEAIQIVKEELAEYGSQNKKKNI